MITKKGRELAHSLEPVVGPPTLESLEALSRMARFAPAYARIQEAWCGDGHTDTNDPTIKARLEASEARLEAIMRRHFQRIPGACTRLRLHFDGDPRGFTVKITTANPARARELRGTDWGGEDVGVG